jgi:long-chain acyl-CoA synthetase
MIGSSVKALLAQDFLEDSAVRLPNKVALVCDGKRWTYGEIDTMANRLAHALVNMGVNRGDRVALYLTNSMESVVGIFAILKAGAVFVVINPTTKRDKLIYILNNCRATVILLELTGCGSAWTPADWRALPSLRGIIFCGKKSSVPAGLTLEGATFGQIQSQLPASCPARRNIDLDLACLIYTSGTTGEPKGVMSDHSNVVFVSGSIIQYLENVESDVVINVLPLSFGYGLYQLLATLRFGGTLVLEKSFAFPAAVLKQVEKEGVTGFPGVPTLFAMLLQMDLGAFDLSSLRYLTNAAAALPESHILQIRNRFPQATLYSMYGLTETTRALYLPPAELDRRPGSVGVPIPGTEAWLEGESGQRVEPGQVGELIVRGRHVLRGYWEDPVTTAQRFRPGPLPGERVCVTGDLFRMDEEGFFYFVSRKDDIIKTRGEKVSPKEVENVLYGLSGVVEAAAVPVPDPILGQAIKAIVVVKGAVLTEAQVLAHCKAHLEDFMIPKQVEFRDQLPKTSSGKIKRTGLV